jgi:hypothetical protein
MHVILMYANTTVGVTTLPTVFTSHAMEYLQEGRALVDIIIIDINIPVISVSNNNGDMQLRVIRSE